MFYYFGAKRRLAGEYPAPEHDTVIEPFAGSAAYSVFHRPQHSCLIEKDERVVELWNRLRAMDEDQIRSLPTPVVGERTSDLLTMLRAASEHSLTSKYITVTPRMVSRWANLIDMLVENIPKVQTWSIVCADYTSAPDIEATWMIDPPYQSMARGYKFNRDGLDFRELGEWCRSRRGQVIVCEQEGADWLPFEPLAESLSTANTKKMEVVWTNR